MKNFYRAKKFHERKSTFGGLIYQSDFDTEYCNGNMASRIASDWKFDRTCRENARRRCLLSANSELK